MGGFAALFLCLSSGGTLKTAFVPFWYWIDSDQPGNNRGTTGE